MIKLGISVLLCPNTTAGISKAKTSTYGASGEGDEQQSVNMPLKANVSEVKMRRIMLLTCATATVTFAAQLPMFAQVAQPLESANISSGRRIAATICVDCHEVSGKTKIGPSFEDIADQSATTAILLKAFLRSNHRNMPNFILSRTDTDDVIAYILSLKRK